MATSRVEIGGRQVGIVDLEDIFREVSSAGIDDEERLTDLIMEKVARKNYIPRSQEGLYRKALYEEYLVSTGKLESRACESADIRVRLYGASCSRCELIDAVVRNVLSKAGERVDYEYVTDLSEMSGAGIVMTPALTVAGEVVVMGQVPPAGKIEEMVLKALGKARGGKAGGDA